MEATKFQKMPAWARFCLVSATLLLMATSYGLLFAPSRLFQPFALTDSQCSLGATAPYNFFPTLGASLYGVAALGALVLALVLNQGYKMWANSVTKAALAKVVPEQDKYTPDIAPPKPKEGVEVWARPYAAPPPALLAVRLSAHAYPCTSTHPSHPSTDVLCACGVPTLAASVVSREPTSA